MFINTNIGAINAQRNLNVTAGKMGKALERLSSGMRINRAADDAAGLSISEGMRSQIRGLRQASRNAQDAISMVQTAEGAMTEVHSILQRMRELSVQAGNSTLSGADRTTIGAEIETLKNEIDNIADRTKFNGLSLLTGALSTSNAGTGTAAVGTDLTTTANAVISAVDVSGAKAGATYTLTQVDADTVRLSNDLDGVLVDLDVTDGTIGADGTLSLNFNGGGHALSITIVGDAAKTVNDTLTDLDGLTVITAAGSGSASYRVGAEVGQDISVTFEDNRTTNLGTTFTLAALVTDDQSVATINDANDLLTAVDEAISQVSSRRAKLGAAQNQVEAAINSLGVAVENMSASESRIRDADIAEVSTELVTRQIMQQAGVSVLAQANTSSQSVLQLLG
jgi:flagellin